MYKLLIGGIMSREIDEMSRIKIHKVFHEIIKEFKSKSVDSYTSGCIIRELRLATSQEVDAWFEYTCYKDGVVIESVIIYDQMPDYVLDRINELGIYKNPTPEKPKGLLSKIFNL